MKTTYLLLSLALSSTTLWAAPVSPNSASTNAKLLKKEVLQALASHPSLGVSRSTLTDDDDDDNVGERTHPFFGDTIMNGQASGSSSNFPSAPLSPQSPLVAAAAMEAEAAEQAREPSSFLVEFDVPPVGIHRLERMRLELEFEQQQQQQRQNTEQQPGGVDTPINDAGSDPRPVDTAFENLAESRRTALKDQHAAFEAFLKSELHLDDDEKAFIVRHEFFDLMNGMSIELEGVVSPSRIPQVLEKIRSLPGVTNVSPLTSISRPKVIIHDSDKFDAFAALPQLSTAHVQTGVTAARDLMNLTGQGIRIGIIDTGVDYSHEALGSCYGPGCKIQFGYDFVDPYRRDAPGGYDCVGHGTHVAGIIAGYSPANGFFGVAPQATLGAYRVFPCTGSAKDDVIIAALERAHRDGMDIVNLSLGGGSSWSVSPLAKAAGQLVRLGVVVVAAIGNDGEQGLDEVSSPAINKDTVAVASFEGSGYYSSFFEISGIEDIRFDYSDKPPMNYVEKPLSLVLPSHDPEGCKPYPFSVNGGVVFLKRGSCTFAEKAKFAQDAGAIGCIFYNNVEGGLRPKVDDPNLRVFGHGITMQQGLLILEQLHSTHSRASASLNSTNTGGSDSATGDGASIAGYRPTVIINYKKDKGVFKNEMANQISTFSSWGLGPELEMKPDIGAPGGYIYSTVPVSLGSYSTMSGTSMATPYVAGAAALLLQADPKVEAKAVLGRLQLYSKPGFYKTSHVPDSVARQGSGMVHIFDSIRGRAVVSPTHLALNDTEHLQQFIKLTVTNGYETAETFNVSHVPAMSILGFGSKGHPLSTIEYSLESAEVILDQPSIHLEAGESKELTIQFIPPKGLDTANHWVYSGYIQLIPTSGLDASIAVKDSDGVADNGQSDTPKTAPSTTRPVVSIPYAGMKGTYNTVDILDIDNGYPLMLGPSSDGRLVPVTDGRNNGNGRATPHIYTMTGNNIVTVLLKVSNPVRRLDFFVMDRRSNDIVGVVPVDARYIGRTDSVKAKFHVVSWSGRVVNERGELERLPNGEYSMILIAQKPFADSQSAVEGPHETWVSPPIVIQRKYS